MDNPFARVWTVIARHEPESMKRLRRENLAGLSGRVLDSVPAQSALFGLRECDYSVMPT